MSSSESSKWHGFCLYPLSPNAYPDQMIADEKTRPGEILTIDYRIPTQWNEAKEVIGYRIKKRQFYRPDTKGHL